MVTSEKSPIYLPGNLPFIPDRTPEVIVTPCKTRLRSVECLELQWLQAIPYLNEHTIKAAYDLETGLLDIVEELIAVRSSAVHGSECVLIRRDEYCTKNDWMANTNYWYCRMISGKSEMLAVEVAGQKPFTLKDKGFDEDWGGMSGHVITDDDQFEMQEDYSYRRSPESKGWGAGTWNVTIGANRFRCLRAIEPLGDEHKEVCEIYIDETTNRTVLFRQYRGRLMRYHKDQDPLERNPDDRFPQNRRLVIDGCTYVQSNCTGRSHDVITHIGLGLNL